MITGAIILKNVSRAIWVLVAAMSSGCFDFDALLEGRDGGPASDGDTSLRDAEAVGPDASLPDAEAVSPDAASAVRGPIAYWRFDEAAGGTVADLTGNGNDGVLLNVVAADWVPHENGTAVTFNGTDGWMRTNHTASLDGITRELTIGAWVNLAPFVDSDSHIILTQQLGDTSGDHYWFGVIDGHLELESNDLGVSADNLAVVPTERWVHVAVTFDGATEKLWTDGMVVAQVATSSAFVPEAKGLFIAAGYNTPESGPLIQELHGAIDELVLYDRALSESEIGVLARGETPPGR